MKLSELKVGMKVWHPTFGKGKVPKIDSDMEECTVFFEDMVIYPAPVFEDSNPKGDPFSIGNLYPYPVTVIATEEVDRLNGLVSAQDDLIDLLESGYLSNQRARDLRDLKNKIEKLKNPDK